MKRPAPQWLHLIRTIFRESWDDDIAGEAAKVAFYFFLSFFPAILAIFSLTGMLGGDHAFRWIMSAVNQALPGEAAHYLESFVVEITGNSRPGMLSLGLLLYLWSASNIFAALADSLNTMYDLEEQRGWWRQRLLALVLLTVAVLLLTLGSAAILAGPEIVSGFGLPGFWLVLRWLLAFLMLTGLLALIYHILPNRKYSEEWWPLLAGSAVGTSLWMLGTLAFRLYISSVGGYSQTYGVVGGVIVLLLWLYLTAFSVLLGGEVAATIEQHKARE